MAYTPEQLQALKNLIGLNKFIPAKLNEYKEYYILFLGKKYKGCSCSAQIMYSELRQWLINNKLL